MLKLHFNRYRLLLFIWFIIHHMLFFGVLFIISVLLIVDLFVQINRIRINWSWNLSSGALEKFCGMYPNRTKTSLPPPQVCGRSCRGFRLGVHNCSLQLIVLLDIKSPSSSSFKPSFVYCRLLCIISIVSEFIDHGNFPCVC